MKLLLLKENVLFSHLLKIDFGAEQGKKRRLAGCKSSIFDTASVPKDALRVISSLWKTA